MISTHSGVRREDPHSPNFTIETLDFLALPTARVTQAFADDWVRKSFLRRTEWFLLPPKIWLASRAQYSNVSRQESTDSAPWTSLVKDLGLAGCLGFEKSNRASPTHSQSVRVVDRRLIHN